MARVGGLAHSEKEGGDMIDWLLVAFAMLTGFMGGVMYTREVYRPLVDWYWQKVRRGEW